ncbi:nucleolar protein 14 homolog [Anopheles marshallii]|uniref:nucleolar protein 14 homolog n=1 Tax=Anopheles marshallii TaxID=1521116 RepID=UPI00237A0D95|nr:nucleolar protein 14 homolog [Anopheles marshallii]
MRSVNLFETLVMKRKHTVLNQGTASKRPGRQRKISNRKRFVTLGKEIAVMRKSNRFVDERTNNKHVGKKAQTKLMYNLNLTHRGQTLYDIENLNHVPDGVDGEDEDRMLQDSFITETNFGGGSADNEGTGKDRKTVIEEMIAHSKRQNAKRQQENDELYEMRQKLDEESKHLMPRIDAHIGQDMEVNKQDGYDRVLREMVFKPHGSPTDKRKCCDAKKEAEKGQKIDSDPCKNIDVPKAYNQFLELMDSRDAADGRIGLVIDIIHTLNMSNNPHGSYWSVLFAYLLKYVDDRFTQATDSSITVEFQTTHRLTPLLHDIAKRDASGIGKLYLDLLQEKYAEFKTHPQRYPGMGTLIVLKLVPVLFSSTIRNRSIVTSVLVFIGEILTRCPVHNRSDISRGLFLVTTVLECVEQTKGFFPSAVVFLLGVLGQACPEGSQSPATSVGQPFKGTSTLVFPTGSKDFDDTSDGMQLSEHDLLSVDICPSFKMRAIACTISLVTALCTQLEHIEAIPILAGNFLQLLLILQKSPYLKPMQEVLQRAKQTISKLSCQSLPYLVKVVKKPKLFPLLEPEIEPAYGEAARRRLNVAAPLRVQRRKLQQKVKKVTRAAKREIRLDNEYIAKLRHKVRTESDRERSQKVRQIFSYISSQQDELNAFERMKRHKK